MKKLSSVTITLTASLLLFTACKKNYTCVCKDKSTGDVETVTTINHASKPKAKRTCEETNVSLAYIGTVCGIE